MEKWGKFIVVYEPGQADIVLMVTSRPTEDILAVYDAHGWPGNQYLWRMMGRSGLQQSEAPFVSNLEKAFEQAKAKSERPSRLPPSLFPAPKPFFQQSSNRPPHRPS